MEYETLVNIQGYIKFILLALLCIVFYSYAFSIYKRNRKSDENYRDFEKYSNLVLDDSIESKPLEEIKKTEVKKDNE